MEEARKVVGTSTVGYNELRNFYNLPYQNYVCRKKQNLFKVPAVVYNKLTGKTHPFFWNAFMDLDLNNADLFHFFNVVSFGKKPWITTFETELPRWGYVNKRIESKAVQLLAGESCKKIIALSECSARIQRSFIYNKYPSLASYIDEKLIVLRPSQKKQVNSIADKVISDKVIFTFIGSEFFRKGGKEILMAFDRLYKEGWMNWELNIISRLELDSYASGATGTSIKDARKIIGRYPNNINHHLYLTNHLVLALLQRSNVGLLPTYADTFGYSVLEAQGTGCPVITTNIRALPEINDNLKGWIVEVPRLETGDGVLNTEEDRKRFSGILLEGLTETLKNILSDPTVITKKGLAALEGIDKKHSVIENTRKLESIYDEITGSALKK